MKNDSKTILDKIKKVVLGEEEIKLAEMVLEDGTTIFADAFEAGESVYLIEGEERIALPVGEYLLTDGKTLVVVTEGVIDAINETMNSEEELKEVEEKVTEMKSNISKLTKENKQMKAEMAKPASKGIKQSPEGKGAKVVKQPTNFELTLLTTPQRVASKMENTPFYNDFKLSTTTSMTSTYEGEFAGEYISAATLQGVTLGAQAITVKPNIKYKEVVKKIAASSLLANASCDFSATGTVTLTERILTPKELQVNLELCKSDFKADWEAISMGYSAFDTLPPNFQAYFAQKMAEIINASIETSIWHGVEATAGQFGGFVPALTADATVVDEAGTTITAANVIAELGTVVDAIPDAIYNTEDLTIYVAPNVGKAYIRALGGFAAAGVGGSGTGAMGTQWFNGGGLNFDGIPIFIANGLNSNYMVAAQKSNLWYGTGLLNDTNEVKILDMADIDGSKNVRFVMRFTGGVQYGVGSEIVLYTPA